MWVFGSETSLLPTIERPASADACAHCGRPVAVGYALASLEPAPGGSGGGGADYVAGYVCYHPHCLMTAVGPGSRFYARAQADSS